MFKPENPSVLLLEGVRSLIGIMADLFRVTFSVRVLAMDSKESFLSNRHSDQERMAEQQDIKRLLSVYYQQDAVTEWFPDFDGEGNVAANG